MSKLVERVVAKQLMEHINVNNLDNPHQSAYKPGHSTETALLSIKKTMFNSLYHVVNLQLWYYWTCLQHLTPLTMPLFLIASHLGSVLVALQH